MWVKICANTNLEDATVAANLGAEALGFVFAPSKRQVTPEQIAEIAPSVPQRVERVGVFTDATPDEIARIARIARLDAVQMHGPFEEGRFNRVRELLPEISIIPVVHWDVANEQAANEATRELQRIAEVAGPGRVLIDAKVGSLVGGTGVALDWTAAAPVFQQGRRSGLQLILAGGLRPENVADAIQATEPWGVDVASGVESSPGRKDPARLELFLKRAHGG